MNNPPVAEVFHGIAGLLEIKNEQRFTVVAIARRAWCEAHHIVNTLPTNVFMDLLSAEKSRQREAVQAYA